MLFFMICALFGCLYAANWAIARWMKGVMEEYQAKIDMPRTQACNEIIRILDCMHERLAWYPDPYNPVWVGTPEASTSRLQSLCRTELPH